MGLDQQSYSKLSKNKCQVLHLGLNNPMERSRLGQKVWKVGKELGVLVDSG